jgi:phosphoglucosamine mutase
MSCVESDQLGRANRIDDAPGRYIEFCKASVSRGFSLRGLRIVLDCANGATYHVAPRVFEELGADTITFCNKPNGTNINEACGSTHPEVLAERVLEYRADVGIAFDGDGDRVVMMDARGSVLDGDELIYIIAKHRQRTGALNGGVVGTLMSNYGLEQALAGMDVPFARAKVGDRYVLEMLHEKGWSLGGESSGHIVCLDLTTTGDAIVAALQALVPAVESGTPLDALRRGMTKLPQRMVNVEVADPQAMARHPALQAAVDAKTAVLCGRGRVLVRPSGTEPVIRVMVEGENSAEVAEIANEIAFVVQSEA